MQANIIDGIYIRVSGQAGRTNGLAWHVIERMFGHLQDLIELLAKYELVSDESPNIKEFEIEIFDFRRGSAVPGIRLVPKPQQELIPIIARQKEIVALKFDELMAYANDGSYEKFFPRDDSLPEVRYDIGEELYGFVLSADNSPISIVQPISANGDYREIYRVPKFTKEQSDYLLRPKRRRKTPEEPEEILGLIQRIGKRRRIIDLYENKDTVLSIAPTQLVLENKIYHLHSPLYCKVQKEEEIFIIENDMLNLYAAGNDLDEAEHDLYTEFDSSYQH